MSKIRTDYIHKNTLTRIYNMFEKNPNKSFLPKDFSLNHNKVRQTYLDVLFKLGLIKKVRIVYFCGKERRIKHEREGYKLKKYKKEMT